MLIRRLRCVAWFLSGLLLGFVVAWIGWLDHATGARFAAHRFVQNSRVYARPLELFVGRTLSRQDLLIELNSTGFQSGNGHTPGTYAELAGGVRLHIPAFDFADGPQSAQRVVVRFDGQQLSALESDARQSPAVVRLPPAELGQLMPLGDRDRSWVDLDGFPPLLITGVQAIEDRQFKHHHGLDPRAILRALWANLRHGGVVQGGSTITQQLVKNLFLSPRRDLIRKINEAIMAVSLERRFSKAEILEAYLNEVYLGQAGARAIHGFGRASEVYFGVPVQALGADQIALLVGMARGASWYHPQRNPERARARRDQVLAVFAQTGLLGRGELGHALNQPLAVRPTSSRPARPHDAFLTLVTRQLQRDYRDRDLRGTGLRVFTTLAPSAQQHAEQALQRQLALVEARPDSLQGAIVLVESESAEIRALVGDRHPGRYGFNRALDARRPIGSVIKPFVYLQALARPAQFTLITPLDDSPKRISVAGADDWQPRNYDGLSHGAVPLIEALAQSYNQASVGLGLAIGLERLFEQLGQFGIDPGPQRHPAALLGAIDLTPFEVAQLYQPLAAEGYSAALRAITEVVDAQGRAIARYPVHLRPVRERAALALLDYALRHAVTDGTARSLGQRLHSDPGVRGKTGTTNDRRDAWFVGYTGQRLGVVWVGRDDHAPANITGASAALPVWAELFNRLPHAPVRRAWPESVEWFWIDWPNPQLAGEHCPNARALPFLRGSQPSERSACLAEPATAPRRRARSR